LFSKNLCSTCQIYVRDLVLEYRFPRLRSFSC